MGIFDALNTSVGGLQAQSFALQNISGNIANASTVGYKGIETNFEDLIPDATTPSRQVAGGVTAFAQATISTQGTVSASTVATNMAINGDGFFSVQAATGTVDNAPVFSGITDYTRRGDFQVNANGNLVNGAGYYLMGVAVDPKTGNPIGNVPQVLQFQNNFVPAQATSAIQYAANLPTTPATTASSTASAGTLTAAGGLNPSDFAQNPLVLGTPPTPFGDNTVTGSAALNQAATPAPITTATALSGTAPSNSLTTSFVAGDTITVDGTVITFVTSGATGNQLNVTDTVGTLLNKIGSHHRRHPNHQRKHRCDHVAHRHGAESLGLQFGAGIRRARLQHHHDGFAHRRRHGRHRLRHRQRPHGVRQRDHQRRRGDRLQLGGNADQPATAMGQDRQFVAWQSAPGHLEPVLSDRSQRNRHAGRLGQCRHQLHVQLRWIAVAPSGSAITIPGVTVNGQSLGNLTMNFGSGALTQFASTGGTATVNTITQNGYAAGQLQSVAINNNGLVVGTFSNGQNIDLASVTLSHFNGTNYLKALNGGAFAVTDQSGPAIAGASGTISGSSLEGSNTDIADEFTKLIVTQQAYSANTKVITTANDMVQSLLSVIR